MFPTSPDVIKAIHADRVREVNRVHLLTAATARPRSRRRLSERIATWLRHDRRTAGGAQPAVK